MKDFFIFITLFLMPSLSSAQDLISQDPKEIAAIISNTVITGVVHIELPKNVENNVKNSAIVNGIIMWEGQKYTLNEKTYKITVRIKDDEKRFFGGAHLGGAFLMITKVEKRKIHFLYRHSDYTYPVAFAKNLKSRKH